jgi:hypothetical protein
MPPLVAGILAALFVLPTPVAVNAAPPVNMELTPGARLVFPYYDIRPGMQTFLFFINVGNSPAGLLLNFYGKDCNRRNFGISLSPHDIDLLDVGETLGTTDPSGASLQGFVDVLGAGDTLLGEALIINLLQDWAIAFPAAATQRLVGAETPFRLFPSKLFVPALLAPGSAGSALSEDGLLILTAPNPTVSGGPLSEQPIQASLRITGTGGLLISRNLAGHQVIVPLRELTDGLPPATLAWVELVNNAVDDAGRRIGLVGLLIQNVARTGGGVGIATRLWRVWSHPLFATSP